MIVHLSNLKADKKYVGVTAVAGSDAGEETFNFTVGGQTITASVVFGANEIKQVVVEHGQLGEAMVSVGVAASTQQVMSVCDLTGDEDWLYPITLI